MYMDRFTFYRRNWLHTQWVPVHKGIKGQVSRPSDPSLPAGSCPGPSDDDDGGDDGDDDDNDDDDDDDKGVAVQ